MNSTRRSPWTWAILKTALINAVLKLTPQHQFHSPVMFTVYISATLTSILWLQAVFLQGEAPRNFILNITLWLWFTLYFANFAEALASARGHAQAIALRQSRHTLQAKRLATPDKNASVTVIPASDLKKGDIVLVLANDFIPSDGEVIQGIASVNESAVTGESAPVIRESGGDRSAVTGGTQVISDWLIIRVTADFGETFLDHIIGLVEGANRNKTPSELALLILLAALTIVFLWVCATLLPFSIYSAAGTPVSITVLVALFVCLAPTTIGGLLSAIGIAGMDRMIQANVIAMDGRAVETAGNIDVLLLDKTGTITLGDRQASEFIPAEGVDLQLLADAALMASLADETPEGRSIVALAKNKYELKDRDLQKQAATFIPFTAETRMSGANIGSRQIRKGAPDAIKNYLSQLGAVIPPFVDTLVEKVSRVGGTPLIIIEGNKPLGVIHLKDIIKSGIRERFMQLREMGIKTIMVTGDHPLTAAAIAKEAGVDDFLANATPVAKLNLIKDLQAKGYLVAMAGDGTNDAPALAQANVALAMNTGTQAAKEAGNLIDLDSNPTKLIEVVQVGKQLLMTRGALTTFSIANDVAKYFTILPAAFIGIYPALNHLNILHLSTPLNAILAAVIFNALIIIALVPLAIQGVKYTPSSAIALLRKHVFLYGVGGLITPFIGIKCIDMLLMRIV